MKFLLIFLSIYINGFIYRCSEYAKSHYADFDYVTISELLK